MLGISGAMPYEMPGICGAMSYVFVIGRTGSDGLLASCLGPMVKYPSHLGECVWYKSSLIFG